MRRADERAIWASHKKSYAAAPPRPLRVGDSSVNLAAACTVISGRNGTGKSRLLRNIQAELGRSAVRLDMHYLCEQALSILRSRTDTDEMVEEFDPLGPDDDRLDDVKRVIGREYDSVEWYALEIEPQDEEVAARFRWSREGSDDPLVPHFRVRYRDLAYSSNEMGLGEFSVHFLFWILDQYRDQSDLTLLLDEPDAYLPPIGVESLLARLLNICLSRRWRLIISTHSAEMITRAVEEKALTLLRVDHQGRTSALHSASTPNLAVDLLPQPAVDRVLFCEDESAWYLTRALLDVHNARLSKATSVVWGNGHGYLRRLHEALPRPPRSEIKFAYVFDGDQRGTQVAQASRWPAVFLPTGEDPDALFREVARDPSKLADRLGIGLTALQLTLDSIEAADKHDWVTFLGDRHGRPVVLRALAMLWAEQNPAAGKAFAGELDAGWISTTG